MTKTIEEILSNIPNIFFTIMVFLVLTHIGFLILLFGFDHDYVYGLSDLFNLDSENNFPSWFSTIILFNCSLLLYIIYKVTEETSPDRFWIILSIIFVYLSIDVSCSRC